jgi:hypothetical protein
MQRLISGPALVAAGLVMAVLSAPNAAEANEEIVLHSFAGGSDGYYSRESLLLDDEGNIYGTTSSGGDSDASIVPRQPRNVLLRLRHDSQIRLQGFPAFGKFLLRLFIPNRRWDDDIISWPPVYRRGNVMF